MHEGDAGWTQIRYKVRVKPIRTYDIFTGGYYQEADLYFMVQYMTAINHGFVGTFYLLNLWGPDSTDAYPSTIDLVRYNDCGLTPCATHLAVNNLFTSDLIGADGYADITIKAIDAQIEVLMYNFLTSNWDRVVNVFDVPAVPGDPPVALTYGGVGVGSTWEGQAEFKDVVVSTPEPACWGCVAFGLIVLLARARRRRR